MRDKSIDSSGQRSPEAEMPSHRFCCSGHFSEQQDRRQMIEAHYAGLFLSGPLEWTPLCEKLMEKVIFITAADGGISHLHRLGIPAQLLIGDSDSLKPEDLLWAEEQGTIRENYPREKDQTDGELAVNRIIADGHTKIIIFAAVGGRRTDHELSMYHYCLSLTERFGLRFIFTDGKNLIIPLSGEQRLDWDLKTLYSQEQLKKLRISAIPLSRVEGLSLRHVKYELEEAVIEAGSTRLISNETGEEGRFFLEMKKGSIFLGFCFD